MSDRYFFMPAQRISVRVNAKLDEQLRREASTLGKAESDVVREALEQYFSRKEPSETCYDLAEKLGLIGCAKRTPEDLSTNRKHFEGFGKS
jgi:predicted DNA-binding protein